MFLVKFFLGKFGLCIYIYIAGNPHDPCFDWKRPSFGGLTFQNRCHFGSNIYLYKYRIVIMTTSSHVLFFLRDRWSF